MNVGNTKINDN